MSDDDDELVSEMPEWEGDNTVDQAGVQAAEHGGHDDAIRERAVGVRMAARAALTAELDDFALQLMQMADDLETVADVAPRSSARSGS